MFWVPNSIITGHSIEMARSHGCLKENEKHRLSVLNNFAIFNNKKENALKKIKRSKVVKLESLSNS